MNDNVIPIKKADRFGLFKGRVEANGEIVETDQVGFAFIKPGSRTFRLKLWMFAAEQYFLATDENDPSKYDILALEIYTLPNQEIRKSWNKVGRGEFVGSFIRLEFDLLEEHIFISLFPEKAEATRAA